MVHSQHVFINEGSAEVIMMLAQDFYSLNLSKTLGELSQQGKAVHVLNSRSKFHQAPLIRQVVAHGLGWEQGEDLVVVRRGEEEVEAEEGGPGAEEGGEE